MNDHYVMLYLNQASTEFTITARKKSARLPQVTRQAKLLGYKPILLAHRLTKVSAESMKRMICSAYANAGYTYNTRPPL
ncbi:hypothetical protein [Ramlibacter sp. WS9]|uniref:hypothetical protein n=1 Tax=Ramlibacter sp. WS9 TaxID=1882741 RepID=UPI00114337B7|nr:hypothetical protein [Ramlibacter sp. WS9]ROZ78871.1 hypothetical protein EEB15_04065 [Ramlibacter sp. WS9]